MGCQGYASIFIIVFAHNTIMKPNEKPFRKIDLEKEDLSIHKIKPKLADGIQGVPDSARVIYADEPNPNDG